MSPGPCFNTPVSGLDTYFFLNLAVGQPSNNMDLSEIEICLGIIVNFFLAFVIKKQISMRIYIYICLFYFRIYCVWSTLSHNKSSVFLSRSSVVYFHHPFLRQLPGVYFKQIIVWKLKMWIQNFDRMKEAWCTRYAQPVLRHDPAVCLQKTVISTYLEMRELEILS